MEGEPETILVPGDAGPKEGVRFGAAEGVVAAVEQVPEAEAKPPGRQDLGRSRRPEGEVAPASHGRPVDQEVAPKEIVQRGAGRAITARLALGAWA